MSALFISQFFLSIYNWRTFFLIYYSEDYVEMAKAKGLPARDIERQYILRPTLPTIITQFALLLIGVWQGAIVTETVLPSALVEAMGIRLWKRTVVGGRCRRIRLGSWAPSQSRRSSRVAIRQLPRAEQSHVIHFVHELERQRQLTGRELRE